MPLVDMKDMLDHAYEHGYAVGSFDVVSLDFLQGVVDAAERSRAPIILSLAESHFDHYDFELLMAAVERAAERAEVPVAVLLDHGGSHEMAVRGINLGCNGVMIDASHLELSENINLTRQVVETAHACGVAVEGELGYVPGVEGEDAERHPGEISFTTVATARGYVEHTGVDCLAVSVGTVHGNFRGKARLDFTRLKQINSAVRIPLVIHGGTGLSEDQFRRLIANGVAKINYYTALSDAAADAVRSAVRGKQHGGITGLTRHVREAVCAEAERCIRLWGATGRAAEVFSRCRPWQPVEHVILYNTAEVEREGAALMQAEGQRVLSRIPGVRRVFSGDAVQEKAGYRHAWVIRFAHPKVIDSYRDHPDHVEFANRRFRPLAGDRVSIDYLGGDRPEQP